MATSAEPAAPVRIDTMPSSVPFIVGNEAAERFNYYGIVAIMTLYMIKVLGMSKAEATEVSHLFKFTAYFMPLLGAWIADRLLGRYRTILCLSLLYCFGNMVMALTVGTKAGLYMGLFLIAVGTGGIKPCVSAFAGDQFGPGREHLLPKIYGMFYWSINFGSFFSFGFLPSVRENYGYRWAFAIPGFAMLLATLIFWLGTKKYVIKPPAKRTNQAGVFRVFWYALTHLGERTAAKGFWDVARAQFSEKEVDGARAVLSIVLIFLPIPLFWSLFDQTNSTWVIQGDAMKTIQLFSFHLSSQSFIAPLLKGFFVEGADPGTLAFVLDTERMQAMNPLYVMILIPVFTAWLYPLAAKLGLTPSPLRRMSVGMLLAAASFVFCGWIQGRMDAGEPMNIAWQMVSYLLITAGEVMLSVTGLEFAFSQAPASMKSTITSFWLMTVAIGNFLVAAVTDLNDKVVKAKGASQFYFYAGLTFFVALIFIWLATRYKERKFEHAA